MSTKINWGYNCLTHGVHHGRPDAIWNLPLLQALSMFTPEELKQLVVARIFSDAMQFVNALPFEETKTGAQASFKKSWADAVAVHAEENFEATLRDKVSEIVQYYASPSWHTDITDVIRWVKDDKLNQNYNPLHSHDSLNMLCRILGVSCSIEASTT